MYSNFKTVYRRSVMGEVDRSWLQDYKISQSVTPSDGLLSRGSGFGSRPDSQASMTSIHGKVVIRPRSNRVDDKYHVVPQRLHTGSYFRELLQSEKERRGLMQTRRTLSDTYLAKIPQTLDSLLSENEERPSLQRRVSTISMTSIMSVSTTQSLITIDDYMKKKKKKDMKKLLIPVVCAIKIKKTK